MTKTRCIQLLIIATRGLAIKVEARRSDELSPTEFLASPRRQCSNGAITMIYGAIIICLAGGSRARILTFLMKDRPSQSFFFYFFFLNASNAQFCRKVIIYAITVALNFAQKSYNVSQDYTLVIQTRATSTKLASVKIVHESTKSSPLYRHYIFCEIFRCFLNKSCLLIARFQKS